MTQTNQKKRTVRAIAMSLVLILMISLMPLARIHALAKAGDMVRIKTNTSYRIRTSPDLNGTIVGDFFYGDTFNVEKFVTGQNVQGYGNSWYQVTFNNKTAYVIADPNTAKQEIVPQTPITDPTNPTEPESTETIPDPNPIVYDPEEDPGTPAYTDAEWQTALSQFPASYHRSLEELHKKYPSWRFEPYFHDYSLEFAADVQLENPARNLVPSYYTAYRDMSNGRMYDAGGWYAINRKALLFSMDPRNWLNEKYIFMFEKLSEVENAPAERRLQYMFRNNPDLYSMIPSIIAASRIHGVSPVFVGSRIMSEVQTTYSDGTYTVTTNAKGMLRISAEEIRLLGLNVDPNARYYNVFNIGAYQGSNPQKNSILYAMGYNVSSAEKQRYGLPWDTQYKAIEGGINFIKRAYLDVGQNTIYYMKYNLRHSQANLRSNVWHQYMGSSFAPALDASLQYTANLNASSLDLGYTFMVPVFQNMMSTAYPNPGNYYPDSVPPQQPGSSDTEYEIDEQRDYAEAGDQIRITASNGYNLRQRAATNSTRVGGVAYNEVVSVLEIVTGDMVAGATNKWYKVRTNSGVVGYLNAYPALHDVIRRIDSDDATDPNRINGDLDEDGKITVSDIVELRLHILGQKKLTNAQLQIADLDNDGKITVSDIVELRLIILNKKVNN